MKITDRERQEMLAMVSPDAVRGRLLARRRLVLALIAGEEVQGVRPGGPEEMLRLLNLRAPLPELSADELLDWRNADPRYEDLYTAYLSRDSDSRDSG